MQHAVVTATSLFAAWQRLAPKLEKHAFDEAELKRLKANPKAVCGALARQVAGGVYRPQPLHPISIPKRSGGMRMLLVPPLADRLVQSALAAELSDRVDASFSNASYAYRPGKSVQRACARVSHILAQPGHAWVLDADVSECFDRIDHAALVALLKARAIWAHQVAWLLRQLLHSEIHRSPNLGFDGPACLWRGLPQGSPLSPLLCNIALDTLDKALEANSLAHVRFADDFLVFASTREAIVQAQSIVMRSLGALGLELNLAKTQCIETVRGFRFLGQDFPQTTPTEIASSLAAPAQHLAEPVPEAVPDGPAPARPPDEDAVNPHHEPLLRTLYLLEPHASLDREGNQLVVLTQGQEPLKIPAARLHQVMAFGATSFTSGAVALCLELGIPVMILSGRGRYFGLIDPLRIDSMQTQRAQFRVLDQPNRSLQIAQAFVQAKIANSLALLRRWHRNRPIEEARELFDQLHTASRNASQATSTESLRGIEGAAAAAYWKTVKSLLAPMWKFEGRRRQPPPDPVNSLLSYGYTMLYYNILSLVSARGLNPYAGFYHAPRSGHHALVSDLMEEFRGPVVDALVMDMVQNGRVKPDDFSWPDANDDACMMSTTTRRAFVYAFEKKLNADQRHAQHGLVMDWRRIMDGQVLRLVQALQGQAARYEPYTIKP